MLKVEKIKPHKENVSFPLPHGTSDELQYNQRDSCPY